MDAYVSLSMLVQLSRSLPDSLESGVSEAAELELDLIGL